MTAILPTLTERTPATLTIYRAALAEVMGDNLWSLDKLAAVLRTDTITLRRFMQASAPDNPNEALRERWLLEKVEAYLSDYRPGPKPRPTRRVQTPSLEYRR